MRALELTSERKALRVKTAAQFALALTAAAATIGLAACGSTGVQTAAKQAPPDTAPRAVPRPPAPPRHAAERIRSHRVAAARPTNATPANGGFYAPAAAHNPGAAAVRCLRTTGLKQAGRGVEANVWEGALTKADLTDPNKKVYVDGPYRSAAKASVSARSLDGIEYSASGGVWVVSASLPSRLRAAVDLVAACLGGSGSARSTSTRG